MPKYQVELTNGQKFVVDADGPPTEADIVAFVSQQQSLAAPGAAPIAPAPRTSGPPAPFPPSFLSQAPQPSLLERGRQFLSPLLGPTATQTLNMQRDGTGAYEALPAWKREGIVGAMSHSPVELIPDIPAPQFKVPSTGLAPLVDLYNRVNQGMAAVNNTAKGFVNFAASPPGLVTAGASTVPGLARLVSGGFAADMALKTPEAAQHAGELSVTGTPQEQANANVGLAAQVLMPGLLGAHALKGGEPRGQETQGRKEVLTMGPVPDWLNPAVLEAQRGGPYPLAPLDPRQGSGPIAPNGLPTPEQLRQPPSGLSMTVDRPVWQRGDPLNPLTIDPTVSFDRTGPPSGGQAADAPATIPWSGSGEHPYSPLTENQLRIMRESLIRDMGARNQVTASPWLKKNEPVYPPAVSREGSTAPVEAAAQPSDALGPHPRPTLTESPASTEPVRAPARELTPEEMTNVRHDLAGTMIDNLKSFGATPEQLAAWHGRRKAIGLEVARTGDMAAFQQNLQSLKNDLSGFIKTAKARKAESAPTNVPSPVGEQQTQPSGGKPTYPLSRKGGQFVDAQGRPVGPDGNLVSAPPENKSDKPAVSASPNSLGQRWQRGWMTRDGSAEFFDPSIDHGTRAKDRFGMDEKASMAAGNLRLVRLDGDKVFYFQGRPNAKQLAELKNIAIERQLTLIDDKKNVYYVPDRSEMMSAPPSDVQQLDRPLRMQGQPPPLTVQRQQMARIGVHEGQSVHEAVGAIARSPEVSPTDRALASFLHEHFPDVLRMTDISLGKSRAETAAFDPMTQRAHTDVDTRLDPVKTTLHEGAHAALYWALEHPVTEVQRMAAKEIGNLMEQARAALNPGEVEFVNGPMQRWAEDYNQGKSTPNQLWDLYERAGVPANRYSLHYALLNQHEFVAGVFNKPEFRQFLDSIKAQGPSLFRRIVDAFKRLLGVTQDSVLDRAFDAMWHVGEDRGSLNESRVAGGAEALIGEEPRLKQTDTPEFKRWFGNSKVVDKEGKPLVVYHTSKSGDVTSFNPLSHFGTKEQAYSLFLGRLRRGEGALKASYPVFLRIKNPRRIEDRLNNSVQSLLEQVAPDLSRQFNAELRTYHENVNRVEEARVAKDIKAWEKRKGWKTGEPRPSPKYEMVTRDFQNFRDNILPNRYKDILIKRMESEGYDGFVYKNEAEADTAIPDKLELEQRPVLRPTEQKDAYVVFHPEQIKSAIGNSGAFDPKNPSIVSAPPPLRSGPPPLPLNAYVTDAAAALPDLKPKDVANRENSIKFASERVPALGRLMGGKARITTAQDEAVATWYAERHGVGPAIASAVGTQIHGKLDKVFGTSANGDLRVVPRVDGMSLKPSDVFETLQKDPTAYQLSPSQRQAYDTVIRPLLDRLAQLVDKNGLASVVDDAGQPYSYFPRIATKLLDPEQTAGARNTRVGGKQSFQKPRWFDTEREGWQAGMEYEPSLEKRITTAVNQVYRALADKRLAEDPVLGGQTRGALLDDLKLAFAPELASGQMTKEQLTHLADIKQSKGSVWSPAFFGKIFDPAIARTLNREFTAEQFRGRKALVWANGQLKAVKLGLDLGASQIQGLPTLFYRPDVWGKSLGRSIVAMADANHFPNYMRQNKEAVRELAQYGSSVGQLQEHMSGLGGQGVSGIPIVGAPFRMFGRQFQTFLDVAKVEMWKAWRDVTPRSEWPTKIREIESVLLSGRSESAMVPHGRSLIERFALLAPTYYRGSIDFVTSVATAARDGKLSSSATARAMGAFVVGSTALYVAMAKNAGMSDDEIVKRLNPARADFMMWDVEDRGLRYNIGMGGVFRSYLRLFGNMAKTSVEHPGNWASLSSEKNPITRWLRGHGAPVPTLAWTAFSGRDFMGKPATASTVAGEMVSPMVVSQEGGRVDKAGGFVGLNVQKKHAPTADELSGGRLGDMPMWERMGLGKQVKAEKPAQSPVEKMMTEQRAAEYGMERVVALEKALPTAQRTWLKTNGLSLAPYETSIERHGVRVPLTADEQARLTKLNEKWHAVFIGRLMSRPDVATMTQARRQDLLNRMMAHAREAARDELVMGLPKAR